jgi:hypothetical protein
VAAAIVAATAMAATAILATTAVAATAMVATAAMATAAMAATAMAAGVAAMAMVAAMMVAMTAPAPSPVQRPRSTAGAIILRAERELLLGEGAGITKSSVSASETDPKTFAETIFAAI